MATYYLKNPVISQIPKEVSVSGEESQPDADYSGPDSVSPKTNIRKRKKWWSNGDYKKNNKRWRSDNTSKYNAYMKSYMANRRALMKRTTEDEV